KRCFTVTSASERETVPSESASPRRKREPAATGLAVRARSAAAVRASAERRRRRGRREERWMGLSFVTDAAGVGRLFVRMGGSFREGLGSSSALPSSARDGFTGGAVFWAGILKILRAGGWRRKHAGGAETARPVARTLRRLAAGGLQSAPCHHPRPLPGPLSRARPRETKARASPSRVTTCRRSRLILQHVGADLVSSRRKTTPRRKSSSSASAREACSIASRESALAGFARSSTE